MDMPTGEDANITIRVLVGITWTVSMLAYLWAARNEKIDSFRPMRIYAAILSGIWASFMFYTAAGLAGLVSLPGFINSGLFSATLMIPTAGYLIASAWVTHKVVRSWE